MIESWLKGMGVVANDTTIDGIALIVSFALTFLAAKICIPLLRKLKFGQQVRDDGPQGHLSKQGTPTMGGIIMVLPILICAPLFIYDFYNMRWAGNNYSFVSILLMLGFGLIGFLDDFIKIRKKRSLGLKAWQKISAQVILALLVSFWAYFEEGIGSTLYVPFVNQYVDIGWLYVPLCIIFTLGLVNAVNLTDGLDGLATSVTAVNAGAYYFVLPLLGVFSQNEQIAFQMGGQATLSAILLGACLGFLLFNAYPAKVFMGDTGSMALGGILCGLLISSRSILLILLTGIMYLASAISVILQVGSYKLRNKKRIFLMAPLHHHFELKGYHETQIVTAYTVITFLMGLLVFMAAHSAIG